MPNLDWTFYVAWIKLLKQNWIVNNSIFQLTNYLKESPVFCNTMFPLYRLGFMPLRNSYWVGLSFLFKKKVSEEWKVKFCTGANTERNSRHWWWEKCPNSIVAKKTVTPGWLQIMIMEPKQSAHIIIFLFFHYFVHIQLLLWSKN